jgi:hypothetical protein
MISIAMFSRSRKIAYDNAVTGPMNALYSVSECIGDMIRDNKRIGYPRNL